MDILEMMRCFNVITLRDHVQCGGMAEGRVFVGRNAIYQNYMLGQGLLPSSLRADLVVKEKMYIQKSVNCAGNSVLENEKGNIQYEMVHGNGVASQPCTDKGMNICSLRQQAEQIGKFLLEREINGTYFSLYDCVTFIGTSLQCNFFSLDFTAGEIKEQLSLVKTINFVAPCHSTLIVNVKGSCINLNPYQFYWNGLDISKEQASHILWNFGETQIIFGQDSEIKGSLLAPQACLWGGKSCCGTVLVKDLVGHLSVSLPTFQGNIACLYQKET